MNKRFFTLMAAVLLTGGALSSAYAAGTDPQGVAITGGSTAAGDVVLANGVKFLVYDSSTSKYVVVKSQKAKDNATYQTKGGTATANAKDASVFEVRNYVKNGLGVSFELYVDGVKFATKSDGAAVTTSDDPVTTFTVTTSATGNYSLVKLTAIKTANLTSSSDVFNLSSANKLYTMEKTYAQADFEEYNATSTTFSFDATNLEGNQFEAVQAIDLKEGALRVVDDLSNVINAAVPGTYFVSGDAKDVKALKAATVLADSLAAAKKLNFVYVQDARYDINALVGGEGYKIVKISGANFYAAKAADRANFNNAAFLNIKEADQLNDEGSISIQVKPVVTAAGASSPAQLGTVVDVVAIKPSATDTKTYVTTYAGTSSSQFTPIYPTLGVNSYFSASKFLKSDGASIYNIYFTSGTPSVKDQSASEYHKYLTQTVALGAFSLAAYATDEADLNSPLSQWVVTNFNNKYTLTLANRQTGQQIELRLTATDADDIYSVTATGTIAVKAGTATGNVNFAGTSIKLVPATVSRNDGFLTLTKAEMENGVKLSFAGKSAIYGKATFYAKVDDKTNPTTLVPTIKKDDAALLGIAKADKDLVNVMSYAYIGSNGIVTSKNDTLLVAPAYVLTYGEGNAQKKVSTNGSSTPAGAFVVGGTSSNYVFLKHADGTYAMNNTGTATAVTDMVAGWASIGVPATTATAFAYQSDLFVPAETGFVAVEVITKEADVDNTTLPAISRHATFESTEGAIAFRENKNGILEGILSAEPMTFWLDTADSEEVTPHFYISKGIAVAEDEAPVTKADEAPAMRNFMYFPKDSATIFNEGSALESKNAAYYVEGTNNTNYKAIFRPAALVAEDVLATVVDGKDVTVVAENADAAKGQVEGLENFQYGIALFDDEVEGEYVIYSKADATKYLYSLNGKLGFTGTRREALVVTLGEGDATANEVIEAESNVQVIGGQGVVTIQGAAGKVITVANILGQTIANQVAASDNVTIAVPAGIVVVAVDGEATKVIVK